MDEIEAIAGDAPVLDRSALERVQRIGGVQLVHRMIRAFLEHVPARVEALQGIDDADAAGRTAHAIKSSAGNLGLDRLRLVAQEIEMRVDLGDGTWPQLRAALAKAMAEARTALQQQTESSE